MADINDGNLIRFEGGLLKFGSDTLFFYRRGTMRFSVPVRSKYVHMYRGRPVAHYDLDQPVGEWSVEFEASDDLGDMLAALREATASTGKSGTNTLVFEFFPISTATTGPSVTLSSAVVTSIDYASGADSMDTITVSGQFIEDLTTPTAIVGTWGA